MPESEPPDLDALWDYDDPAHSEDRFRALVPTAERDDNRGFHVELLTQIARAEGLQRRFDQAHRTLDQAAAMLDDGPSRSRLRYLLERGRILNSAGDTAAAAELFQQAWELGRGTSQDDLAVDAAHMLGIAAPPAERLAWHDQALSLAEASPDPRARRWRASLANNIGWTYHDEGRYDGALAMFEQALAWRREAGQEREIIIAWWCVGRALRSLGRLTDALATQRHILARLDELGQSDGYVHEELAECLLALGQPEKARPHFAAACVALASAPWLAEREPDRLTRLAELGRVMPPATEGG
jgi:tetratricopeptide (TPR) repeat protein